MLQPAQLHVVDTDLVAVCIPEVRTVEAALATRPGRGINVRLLTAQFLTVDWCTGYGCRSAIGTVNTCENGTEDGNVIGTLLGTPPTLIATAP